MKIKIDNTKGFTIIELIVSIGIFALMTALLLAKYGNFNQGILLNNLAYDVALTIRSAQSYGLNVKSTTRDNSNFQSPYGVHFRSGAEDFVFFADLDSNSKFTNETDDKKISLTNIKRRSKINSVCVGSGVGNCTSFETLDVTFKRPDPNAIIVGKNTTTELKGNYAEIVLAASDGTLKKIIVRSTGQIAVQN